MNKPRTCDELGVCQMRAGFEHHAECHLPCTPPPARPIRIEMEGPYQRPRSAWRPLGNVALRAVVTAGACGLAAGILVGFGLGGL